jgi:hypothetical protein
MVHPLHAIAQNALPATSSRYTGGRASTTGTPAGGLK